jgi:two-component system LytT family response regulator
VRVLIVDDDSLSRRAIYLTLQKFAGVEIVGECGDGATAAERIRALSPDVIFLDMQMPKMTGFEVLRALPAENLPSVICLTAHERHVSRAFEVHALDYLLNPVDDQRFAAAVNLAKRLVEYSSRNPVADHFLRMLEKNSKYPSRFAVRTGPRVQVVSVQDIYWIGAAADYAELHVPGRTHLLRETMNALEAKLDPALFIRIHRSRIVRTSCIRALIAVDNREYKINLSDGSEHRSSRTYADRINAWLNSA